MEDAYEEVGTLRCGSEADVPDRCKNVIKELIDTESSYLNSLRDVLQGYQEPIRVQQHLPVKTEDVNIIFGNTNELHAFSRRLLKLFEISQNDINGLASVFLDRETEFKIYTEYCTNHPRSIKTLTSAQKQPTAAEFFYGCQLALGHMLPLSAFLLKPVQRILKYHLLLADLLKQYGKAVSTEDETYALLKKAQGTMESVANYINANMRKEEAKELLKMIQGWTFDDEPGSLVLEGVFRAQGAKVKRKVYIFETLIVMTKRHKDNVNYVYKGHILHSQLSVVDSPNGVKDPLAFQISSTDIKGTPPIILYAKDAEQKNKYITQLRRLILEHHPNLPTEARQKMMESLEVGCGVVPLKDGETVPAPFSRERLQRQRVTRGKRSASHRTKSKDKEPHLEPLGVQHMGLSPAGSMTSLDSTGSVEPEGESDMPESVYTMSEDIYGNAEEQLVFCPSDDSDHEEEEEKEGNRSRLVTPSDIPTTPKCEPLGEDLLDKPEVVVPMSDDYRFSAPIRSCEPRGSMSGLGVTSSTVNRIIAANRTSADVKTSLNRVESLAGVSRPPMTPTKTRGDSRSSSASRTNAQQDKKQKEASMALSKGLVGRLVKKYSELTDDKPEPIVRRTSRGSGSIMAAATDGSSDLTSVTSTGGNTKVSQPAKISRKGRGSRKRSYSLGMIPAKNSAPIRGGKFGVSANASTAKVKSTLSKVSVSGFSGRKLRRSRSAHRPLTTTAYPSLYAVSAELRRDAWRIGNKKRRGSAAQYRAATSSYIKPNAPVSSGRVRDLIARFSVQPM